MESLHSTLKTALEQAAECRQKLDDINQESQRLSENYQDVLQERQTLREANRALMSSVLYLRGYIQNLETRVRTLESSSCCCSNTGSKNGQRCDSERDDDDRGQPMSQLDGKDPEEMEQNGQQLGNLTWIEAKGFEKSIFRHRDIPTVDKRSNSQFHFFANCSLCADRYIYLPSQRFEHHHHYEPGSSHRRSTSAK